MSNPPQSASKTSLRPDLKQCIDQHLTNDARVPVSTYRVQMHANFTFQDAMETFDYLKQLGIGDYYASPIFEARPGSMHGYDVARHDRLNPEVGGQAGFDLFSKALQDRNMGLLLDIVPNHMGVGNDSRWWQDVLENGRASEFAEFFDIDWTPLKPDMQGKLLLPILGNQYGQELESGNIQVDIKDGRAVVCYFDHHMPLTPRSLPMLFPAEELEEMNVPRSFRGLLGALALLPPHDTASSALMEQRHSQLTVLKPRVQQALRSEAMQPVLKIALDRINGRITGQTNDLFNEEPSNGHALQDDSHRYDQLHELLESQPYRLAYWRVSSEEINYRRFFDINDLVGLRMENPTVFKETHCLIRKLLAKGQVTGLRIDHCDGMFDPRQYLIRLQLLAIASQCAGEEPIGPTVPNGVEVDIRESLRHYDWARSQGPLYTVVEKILEPREALPPEWPVRGTSGYDFVYQVNEVFIQTKNEERFNTLYENFIGHRSDPDDIVYRSKLQVMQNSLASEVYVLTNLLSQIAASNRRFRDFTDNILEAVIRETIACFPVYRTYIDDRGRYADRDRAFIRFAISRAKTRNPDLDTSAFDYLGDTLLLGENKEAPDSRKLYFALKFQQLTGPVMAKGVEDTSFYVYNRFISSNEVGGAMRAFGITAETFHASNQDRLTHSPDAMVTTSTHDTKRSEDVRARLNIISEMPSEWSAAVNRWQRMNARFKRTLDDGRIAPDANEEYLLYQTIAGSWPWQMETIDDRKAFLARIKEFATKAMSEAKVNMSWINPSAAYVEAVHGFLDDILLPAPRTKETRFVETLQSILPQLQLFGGINSLAQTVLKVASPGIPDFYQGTEMWDLSLVDPDNRRPVDYALRAQALSALQRLTLGDNAVDTPEKQVPHSWPLSGHEWDPSKTNAQIKLCEDLLTNFQDGRAKLWITHRALALRQANHEVFRRGNYIALPIENDKQQHAIAFLRQTSDKSILAVVPRFACTLMKGKPSMPLGEAWGTASITLPETAPASFLNICTGEKITADPSRTLPLREIFATFPAALLLGD